MTRAVRDRPSIWILSTKGQFIFPLDVTDESLLFILEKFHHIRKKSFFLELKFVGFVLFCFGFQSLALVLSLINSEQA